MVTLLTIWPFAEQAIDRVARQCRTIICPEMNRGQIKAEIERVASGNARVIGVNRLDGEMITPQQILKVLAEA
jgi:2-oxoglutarate ferredoxin oxidoreductase subunit alpha